ncbi:Phytochrome-like protein cph2 [compost metagenome]
MAQSDMALYRSKEKGRNQYHFHNEEINQEVTDRVALANDLRQAIENNELHLHYLPEVDLGTGKILGMGVQVRWNHPQRGWLEPAAFMPAAEKTGIIIGLGHWVLDQACQQMRQWRDQGMAPPVIAIDLSLTQLKTGPELIYDVLRTTARWELAPWDLRFDVTEATLAQTKWTHNDVLPRLCELGVQIAIDDFGTGYSSFDYLKTYRVNHLKLAQRFLDSANADPENATTLRAIINFARDVGIGIIAEGVETQEQRTTLMSSGGAMQAQGHYFSTVVDSGQAAELLKAGTIVPATDHWTRPASQLSESNP